MSVLLSCPNCGVLAKCIKRDFSDQAWSALLVWGEIEEDIIDMPLCDSCYNELRDILSERVDEISDITPAQVEHAIKMYRVYKEQRAKLLANTSITSKVMPKITVQVTSTVIKKAVGQDVKQPQLVTETDNIVSYTLKTKKESKSKTAISRPVARKTKSKKEANKSVSVNQKVKKPKVASTKKEKKVSNKTKIKSKKVITLNKKRTNKSKKTQVA